MADSETSTSRPRVTRRDLLAGAASSLAISALGSHAIDSQEGRASIEAPDMAVSLWQSWHEAYRETLRLCREQQRLETRLAAAVGFPPALPIGHELPAEATVHQARWDAADALFGYSAAKRREEAAAAREAVLAEALSATPASSIAGVAAKLDAVLRQGEWCEDCAEFPWPQLRSALADLVRIGALDVLGEGSDR